MRHKKRMVALLVVLTMLLSSNSLTFAQGADVVPSSDMETVEGEETTPPAEEGITGGEETAPSAGEETEGGEETVPPAEEESSGAGTEDAGAAPASNSLGENSIRSSVSGHRHKVCGAHDEACQHTGEQHTDTVTFTSLDDYEGGMGGYDFKEDANVYVPWDTFQLAAGPTRIEAGVTVNLCLNGMTLQERYVYTVIYMNHFDIREGGTLNICDCSDTGSGDIRINHDNAFDVYGTLNMYGGKVWYSDSQDTVSIEKSGTFNMYGGTITDNHGGAGVCLSEKESTFNLYGGVVDGNYGGSSRRSSNVELAAGALIHIPDKLYAGTHVGVSCSNDINKEDQPGVRITDGYGAHNSEEPSTFFSADDQYLMIARDPKDNGEVCFAALPEDTSHPAHGSCGETLDADGKCSHGQNVHNAEKWTDLNHAPDDPSGKNYYLSDDYVLPSYLRWVYDRETTLCLNGHKLIIEDAGSSYGMAVYLTSGRLRICDCRGGGEIVGGKGFKSYHRYGGSIYVNGGNLELYGGTITGGNADYGGGIYVSDGTFKMYNGTVTDCKCNHGGGGVCVGENGAFDFYGGSVTGNKGYGAGIYVGEGGVCTTYTGSTITGNTGPDHSNSTVYYGGGVHVDGGTFEMKGGTISGNTAQYGSGIYVKGGDFNMYEGTIEDNVNQDEGTSTSNFERGAVYVTGGKFNLCSDPDSGQSGSRIIRNNTTNTYHYDTVTGTYDCDTCLMVGTEIGISSKLDPATTQIGIYHQPEEAYAVTSGFAVSGNTPEQMGCFFDNVDPQRPLVLTSGEVYMGSKLPDHVHKVCGETSCTHKGDAHEEDVTYEAWGDSALSKGQPLNDGKVHNVYLTSDTEAPIVVSGGNTVLNLCLNGYSLSHAAPAVQAKDGAQVNLCDCVSTGSIKNSGQTPGDKGGLVHVDKDSTFNLYSGNLTGGSAMYGSGVYAEGTMNLYGGTISGNQASGGNGGGVYVTGTLNQYGGRIDGNKTPDGKGGGAYVKGTLNLYGGSISENEACSAGNEDSNKPGRGGGVYVDGGTLKVSGGEIRANIVKGKNGDRSDTCAGLGGGVYLASGKAAISDGTVSYNEVDVSLIGGSDIGYGGKGGGIYVESGTLAVAGGTVLGNHARTDGGGIYAKGGTVALSGASRITNNRAGMDDSRGSGIYAAKGAELTAEGAPVVRYNTATGKDSDARGNIYLPEGQHIKVTGDLDSRASLWVTLENDTIITEGYADHGGTRPRDYFELDDAGEGDTVLVWQHQYDIQSREAFAARKCSLTGTVSFSSESSNVENAGTRLWFYPSSETRILTEDGEDYVPDGIWTDKAAGSYSSELYQGIDFSIDMDSERYGYKSNPEWAHADSGEKTKELNITATATMRKGSMRGVVTGQDGKAIEGATVTLHAMDTEMGEMTYSSVTDADGNYRLSALIGHYDVTVTKPGYDITIDKEDYWTVSITGGSGHRDMKVTDTPIRAKVSGHVENISGWGLEGGKVILTGTRSADGKNVEYTSNKVDRYGNYKFQNPVDAGTYTVTVEKKGAIFQVADGGTLSIETAEDITHDISVNMSFIKGVLKGDITVEDPELLKGATIIFTGKGDYSGTKYTDPNNVEPDGKSYKNVTLMAGTYTVTMEKPGYTITVDEGSSVKIDEETVKNGTIKHDLKVTVKANGGTVSGSVTDADDSPNSMEGAKVTLTGRTITGQDQTYTAEVKDGKYQIADVPSGTYAAAVTKDGYTVSVNSGSVVTVENAENSDVENDITVEASLNIGTVSGSVTDTNIAPESMAGVTVTFTGESAVDKKERTFTAIVGEDGTYSVKALAGTYTITVEKPGYTITVADGSDLVEVTGGAVAKDISAAASRNTFTVSGKIYDAGGEKISSAKVTFSGRSVADGKQHTFECNIEKNDTDPKWFANYTVTGVEEGTYDITVTAPNLNIVVKKLQYDGEKDAVENGKVAVTKDVSLNMEINSSEVAGTVSGTVTDIEGVPMKDVVVRLTGESLEGDALTYSTITGEDGKYAVLVARDGDRTGGYTVTVEKPGYTVGITDDSKISVNDGYDDITGGALAKDVTADITVTAVQNKGTVSGEVTGAGVKLMEGAAVTLTGTSVTDGDKTYTGTVAKTGEDYRYEVPDVLEGTYEVTIEKDGAEAAVSKGSTVSMADTDVTNDIEVNASLDIWTVSGKVTDTDGSPNPMEGAAVTFTGTSAIDGSERSFSTAAGADGSYSLKVLKGSYTVTVAKPGYDINIDSGGTVDVSSDTANDINVKAYPRTHTVSGSVTGAGAALMEGAEVHLNGTSVALGRTGQDGTVTKTADGGYRYEVPDVLEGTYEVTVSKDGFTVQVSAGSQVTVENGDVTGQDITLEVSFNMGVLTGTVTDSGGKSVAGAKVSFTGDSTVDSNTENPEKRTFDTVTDADGNYSVNVLEGSYTVGVQKPGYTVIVTKGNGVKVGADGTFSSGGEPEPDGHTIKVTLARNIGTVSGSVTDTDASLDSMDGATVTLTGRSAAGKEETFTAEVANGQYSIKKVPEGIYKVTVQKPGYEMNLTSGDPVSVVDVAVTNDIELQASLVRGLLKGTVKDEDGSVMTGAEVTLTGTATADGLEKTFTGKVSEDGTYSIEALEGSYKVLVSRMGYETDKILSGGGEIALGAEDLTNDITVRFTRNEGTVSGAVTEQNGIDMDGATVTLTGAVTKEEFTAGVSDGSYDVKVPTGIYRISVQKAGYDVTLTSSDSVLVVKDAQREKDIHVEAALIKYKVAGKAVDTNGLSLLDAAVVFINQSDSAVAAKSSVDGDGNYAVELPPGDYAIKVLKPGYGMQINDKNKESVTVQQADISGFDLPVTGKVLTSLPGGKLDADGDGVVTKAELVAALGLHAKLTGSKGAQVITLTDNVALEDSLIVNVKGLTLELGEYRISGPAEKPAVVLEKQLITVSASEAGGIDGGSGAPAVQCENKASAILDGGAYIGGDGAPGARVSGSIAVQNHASVYGSAGQAGVEGPDGVVYISEAKVSGGDGAPGGTGIQSMKEAVLYAGAIVYGGNGTDNPDADGGAGGSAFADIETLVMSRGVAFGGHGGIGQNQGGKGGDGMADSVGALEAVGRGVIVAGAGGDAYITPGKGGKANPGEYDSGSLYMADGKDGRFLSLPVITAQPQNQTALVGETAEFRVQAESPLEITYQWQADRGKGFTDISGATETSYTTPVLALTDSGIRYRCVVTNENGSTVSNEALLTVKEKVYDVKDGGDHTWDPAGSKGYTVTVDGPAKSVTAVYVDGILLAPQYYEVKGGGHAEVTLKPEYLRTLAPGQHTLRIEFADGYAETTFTVQAAKTDSTAGDALKTTDALKTGDAAESLWIWILTALAAGGVVVGTLYLRRRRRRS